jgi:hypothetical protein
MAAIWATKRKGLNTLAEKAGKSSDFAGGAGIMLGGER